MRSQSTPDRPHRVAVVLLALPFIAVAFFWAMLALVGLLGQADDPSTALWAVALVAAVGFVAVAVLSRLALIAGSVLLLAFHGLRGAGRMLARITHAGVYGA